jgi:hypothetical protein
VTFQQSFFDRDRHLLRDIDVPLAPWEEDDQGEEEARIE